MQSAVKRRRLIGKQKADHFDRQNPEDDDLELIIVDHFDRQKPEDDDLELIIVEPQGGPAKRHHLQAARHGLEPRTFRKMLRLGLPIALFNLIWFCHQRGSQGDAFGLH